MELSGRSVLITGGGTGLGREICLELARSKMKIAINFSRSQAEAFETAELVRSLGSEALLVQGDVASSQDVENIIKTVTEHFGGLDIVVANAGTTVFRDFSDLNGVTEDDWDRIMGVNVKGVWLTIKTASPFLKESGFGRVVITTSVAGIRPQGSSLPYSVSKAAANHLTKGLAKAMGPEVLVNAIAPGLLDTRWTQGHSEASKNGFVKSSPLHRIPTVLDCARQVRALIETDSMTGSIVTVDAGSSL